MPLPWQEASHAAVSTDGRMKHIGGQKKLLIGNPACLARGKTEREGIILRSPVHAHFLSFSLFGLCMYVGSPWLRSVHPGHSEPLCASVY